MYDSFNKQAPGDLLIDPWFHKHSANVQVIHLPIKLIFCVSLNWVVFIIRFHCNEAIQIIFEVERQGLTNLQPVCRWSKVQTSKNRWMIASHIEGTHEDHCLLCEDKAHSSFQSSLQNMNNNNYDNGNIAFLCSAHVPRLEDSGNPQLLHGL